jgi:hypothetical protein
LSIDPKEVEKLKAQVNRIYEGLSGIVSAFNELEESYQMGKGIWDPNAIKWVETEGPSGKYERANQQTGNRDYEAMLKDLQDHQGQLTRDGYFFWAFQHGAAVGRKRSSKSKST